MNTALEQVSKKVAGFSIVLSILLIICGVLAIALPVAMSLGVVVVIAWLLMISGIVQFVHVFRCEGVGNKIWRTLVALAYFGMGIYLRMNLAIGLAALTLAMIIFFLAEGVFDIAGYLMTRKSGASGWLLVDGVITLLLGIMIWRHWPSSSFWVIGTFAGISMIMSGTTRLMLSLAVGRALRTAGQPA